MSFMYPMCVYCFDTQIIIPCVLEIARVTMNVEKLMCDAVLEFLNKNY